MIELKRLHEEIPEEKEMYTKVRGCLGTGDMHRSMSEYVQAVAKYREALRYLPEPVEHWHEGRTALYFIATLYKRNGHGENPCGLDGGFKEALEILTLLVQHEESFKERGFHWKLAVLYYELGDLENATKEFRLEEKLFPVKIIATRDLGETMEHVRFFKKAIKSEKEMEKVSTSFEDYLLDKK